MWLLSNLQTTQIIILIWPCTPFPSKCFWTLKLAAINQSLQNLGHNPTQVVLLTSKRYSFLWGKKAKEFCANYKRRPHHFILQILLTISLLCCVYFLPCAPKLALDVQMAYQTGFHMMDELLLVLLLRFCACLLALAHSFIYIQNTCNKCASPAHVNQPRL